VSSGALPTGGFGNVEAATGVLLRLGGFADDIEGKAFADFGAGCGQQYADRVNSPAIASDDSARVVGMGPQFQHDGFRAPHFPHFYRLRMLHKGLANVRDEILHRLEWFTVGLLRPFFGMKPASLCLVTIGFVGRTVTPALVALYGIKSVSGVPPAIA
jgi:hypothetical protein